MSEERPQDAVRSLLAQYGRRAQAAVLDAVPVHEPRRDLYDLVYAHLLPSGKGLRPAIVMATCGALGGDVERALAFAVPIELLHSAFLVHDDIQDASPRRRGQPALHAVYGIPLALNTGDALASLAAREMSRAARAYGDQGIAATEEFQDVVQRTIEGQAIEIGFRTRINEATDADYLEVVARKTAAYTMILPMRLGALAATGNMTPRGRFERFGFYLGALFQLRDDVRNLWPDDGNAQSAGSDIVEGKLTLMVIHALRVAPPDESARLADTLRTPDVDADRVRDAIAIVERNGGREYGESCARALAGAATQSFSTAFSGVRESRDREFLAGLPQFVLES